MNVDAEQPAAHGESEAVLPPISTAQKRLWAPWRMRYVGGGTREPGCIFCNRLAEDRDADALILHRGDRAFAIMNLFPYNTGHVMIVPNAHVDSPESADLATMQEMTALRGPLLRALRRALGCDGFNLGLNVGAVAGAGVAEHLHEHVVPRWHGDANFMPILASTMVMPEMIPVTYAKLRAELVRELTGGHQFTSIIVSPDRELVLIDGAGRLPQAVADNGEAVWRAALRDATERGARDVEIAGWAGEDRASDSDIVLLLRAALPENALQATGHAARRIADLQGEEAARVRAAVARLDDAPIT
ncbi:MAG: HIT domain-containing protein [Thermomicrobiales bacterium]|nr:HIT domain-containing protein [Thermomicrobiales bacterium]